MSLSERRRSILNAVSIVEIIGEYMPLRQSDSSLKSLCPFTTIAPPLWRSNPLGVAFNVGSVVSRGMSLTSFACTEPFTISQALDMLEARTKS